jgi:pseudo-rSAM protein
MEIKRKNKKMIDLKTNTKPMIDFFEAKNRMLLQDKSITSLFFNNIPATLNENEEISESQLETFKLISTITNGSVYVIDFHKQCFLFVSNHDLFLSGFSPDDDYFAFNIRLLNQIRKFGNLLQRQEKGSSYSFLNHLSSPKYILCSYHCIKPIQPAFENNFSYRISVCFPIDMQQWNYSRQVLLNQALPVEYVFDVLSDEDVQQVERLVAQFQIAKYCLNPIYNGENIRFFEENAFLTKEDILSTSMSIKDFFSRQSINLYDFGKINIMSNGDAYANVNHPVLGNIYTHNIYEIVHKEVEEGKSWFNIRNQAPCNNCVYQWLCPPPSNYEY